MSPIILLDAFDWQIVISKMLKLVIQMKCIDLSQDLNFVEDSNPLLFQIYYLIKPSEEILRKVGLHTKCSDNFY